MSKKPLATRPVGRPPLNKPAAKRHFLQVERETGFDVCLLRVREIMAKQDGCTVEEVSQSKAVRYAIYMIANRYPVKQPRETLCPRCNGAGYIAIRNGDDDVPCPECSK